MSLHKKLEGAVRGGALGDALGLPVEIKTYQEIKEKYGTVDKFHPLRENVFAKKAWEDGTNVENIDDFGYISDDTILTLAGLQTLINKHSLDIVELFKQHIIFAKKYNNLGFGKGTLEALAKIEQGTHPTEAGSPSRGNGVMMKQLPYAFHFIAKNTSAHCVDEAIMTIARCTHTAPIAVLTAVIHNRLLVDLLKQDANTPINRDTLLCEYLTVAEYYEQQPWYTQEDQDNRYVTDIIKKLQQQWQAIQNNQPYDAETILELYTTQGTDQTAKRGFHVASTMGYTRSIFLQKQNRDGLLDAINIGQDTDTQAAIIGNMIGAYKGEFYDQTLIQSLKSKEEIARVLQEVKKKYAL